MSQPSYSDVPSRATPSDSSNSGLIPVNQGAIDKASTPEYSDTSKEVFYQPWNYDSAKVATSDGEANHQKYVLAPPPGADGNNYYTDAELHAQDPATAKVLWYKRKRIWITAIAVLLVVIGVVVGCVVGLKAGQDEPSDSAESSTGDAATSSTQASACRGKTCGQIFSAALLGNELHLMATGDDKELWIRVFDGTKWKDEWFSLGNSFRGQPSAVAWLQDTRIDVYGVTDSTNSIEYQTYMEGSWSSSWKATQGQTRYALATCHVQYGERERMDAWLRGLDEGLWHDAIKRMVAEDSSVSFDHWDWESASKGSRLGSAPAMVCRNDATYHDAAFYNLTGRGVQHVQFSDEDGWTQSDRGGRFVGDPVLVSPSSSRIDFFGTGEDDAIHHFTWSKNDGYTDLENLGGEFESVPAVVATSSNRLDVVALGKDDKLKHRALIGSTWTSDWEDLEIFSNSAPLVVKFGSAPIQIGVFVLGEDKDVMFATWNVTESGSWKEEISNFTSIGGTIGTIWLDGTE